MSKATLTTANYKAPFKPDGSVPYWVKPCLRADDIDWHTVEPFEASIRFETIVPTASGKRYEVVNVDTNARYCVFNRDLRRLEQRFDIWGEVIKGWWKVQKYGQNYGIYYLGEEL